MHNNILDTLALNSIQREAVAYIDGPELVFAGAGTGKTRVLTAKIAYLIDQGYHPSSIFAATFTNKAAREMRERVERFVSMPVSGLWIGTFHSLCAKILRREAKYIGYEPSFTIYDTSDQTSVVKKLLALFNIDDKVMPPKYLLSAISSRKAQCITPEECEQNALSFRDREFANLYKAYQKTLKDQQAMDFDDLLCNTVYMLKNNKELLESYREQFKYVLVDEYQDTNRAQFFLVHLLSKGHGKIFAVGDDDQSIYGWRGAMIENILSFEKEFPNTKIFKLEENYRSTSAILSFANSAIKANTVRAQKELWTGRSGGVPVLVNRFRDDRQEADYVASECEQLIRKMSGTDIAVLFRTNSQSRIFEETFRKKRIPYVLVGGMSFYERMEIKDCMAYMRLLVNVRDDVSFERIMNVPARGLGDKAKESLAELAKAEGMSLLQTVMSGKASELGTRSKKGFDDLRETFELLAQSIIDGSPPAKILEDILQLSGYMDMLTERASASEEDADRIENINELMNALTAWQDQNPDGTLANFLEEISLASDIDGWNAADNAVSFMTMHCSKGLEFKVVFLVGVEDGIIPSRQNIEEPEKVEEERRLFYVGCTRAMDALRCCYADQRFRFGNIQPSDPSRFLADVPKDKYEFNNASGSYGGGGGYNRYGTSGASGASGGYGSSGRSGGYGQGGGYRSQQGSGYGTSYTRRQSAPSGRYDAKPKHIDDDLPPWDADNRKVASEAQPAVPAYDEFSQVAEPQYRVGQNVTHKTYGKGRIVSLSGFGPDMMITVLFGNGERKKLMAKFAKLE